VVKGPDIQSCVIIYRPPDDQEDTRRPSKQSAHHKDAGQYTQESERDFIYWWRRLIYWQRLARRMMPDLLTIVAYLLSGLLRWLVFFMFVDFVLRGIF